MKEEDLENLNKEEYYVLSPKMKQYYFEHFFLLRNGEIVKGIRCSDKEITVRRVKVYGDTYLGVGVFHV
jgi:hypothetical protein